MKTRNQIKRIKIKLRLAKNTDSFFEVFGASSHKYILGSPLNVQEISDFEKTYNITLPDSYKTFLSKIGNGGLEYKEPVVGNSGAGPDYGLFKLGHPEQFVLDVASNYLEREAYFDENTSVKEWEKIHIDDVENYSDEEYYRKVEKAYSGILFIGYSGCSAYLGLMLNGKNKGRVIQAYSEFEYCPNFFEEANFLDWYENWLDKIISGERIMRMDSNIGKLTEEYIVNQFIADIDDDYWKFRRLGELRSLKKLSKNAIKRLTEKYKNLDQIDQKICVLNFLTKYDYDNSIDEIAKLAKEYPMAFLRNIHLYNRAKSNEWLNEINKLRELANSEVLEYIEFVTDSDIKNYCQHGA